jgi:hypothetical protein
MILAIVSGFERGINPGTRGISELHWSVVIKQVILMDVGRTKIRELFARAIPPPRLPPLKGELLRVQTTPAFPHGSDRTPQFSAGWTGGVRTHFSCLFKIAECFCRIALGVGPSKALHHFVLLGGHESPRNLGSQAQRARRDPW